ncbi:MAG: polysaccharide biosynthesis tyrosine autokinase [Fimbriimonadaceae bacterium]|nr:polysaccharide biosynthesis tyrosine autokinase [Fimbriimonadaceae bacterium]
MPRQLTLKDVLGIFRRQRYWIATILIGSLCLGYAAVVLTTPVYRTTTTIAIAQARSSNDPVGSVTMQGPTVSIPTQMQILQSPVMFDDKYWDKEANRIQMPANAQTLSKVKVDQVGDTNVLNINVESTDPLLAKTVAAAIPDYYKKYTADNQATDVEMARRFVETQLLAEKDGLKGAQKELQEYRNSRQLQPLEGEGGDRSKKASDAEVEVVKGETAVKLAQERLSATESERRKEAGSMVSNSSQTTSRERFELHNQIDDLKAQRSRLSVTFLDDNPQMVELDAQIAAKERQLKNLPKEIDTKTSLTNPDLNSYDFQIAQARIALAEAQKQLDEARRNSAKFAADLKAYQVIEPKQSELEQAVSDSKAKLLSLQNTLDALNIRKSSNAESSNVLAAPSEPEIVKPKDLQYLLLAFFMGAFCAVGFALLKDSVEDKVTSTDEIYGLTGLPSLGEIPQLPRRGPTTAIAPLNDRMLENYRVLRFNLLFSTLESPVKSIVVTSSGPNEGKTEFACNLAVAASGEGRRVILVDGNIRNPMIHKKMNIAGKPGLTDVVMGHATLEESLHSTMIPGLHVLTCGTQVMSPAELFASPAMTAFMRKLADGSDLVIFDAPNCGAGADALVLSNVAESVLFVAKSGSTKRTAIRKGIDSLRQVNARVLGVAMNGAA